MYTYKDVLLHCLYSEATMSAPTYFNPTWTFCRWWNDTYNNPVLAGFMGTISYSFPKGKEEDSAYDITKLCIFSFGRNLETIWLQPNASLKIKGLDIKFLVGVADDTNGTRFWRYANRNTLRSQ